MRNSDRSFVKPRNAMTATGTDAMNVKLVARPASTSNGDSSRNLATWTLAAIEICPSPKLIPFESVKKKETVAA